MKNITVNGKDYAIKFGYYAVASSNIIEDVVSMQCRIDAMEKIEDETQKEVEQYKLIADIIPLVGRITLAGLQKYHDEEFGVDYDNDFDVKIKLRNTYRLLDDYFDPEEGETRESALDMFFSYVEELTNAGFLSGEKVTEEVPTPKKPQDHKKPQK